MEVEYKSPYKKRGRERVMIDLEKVEAEALKKYAAETDLTLRAIVRKALRAYLTPKGFLEPKEKEG